MPSIKDAIKAGADMKGYAPAPALPVLPQMVNDNRPKANPSIRCPLPPFNSDPDTLRQFETGYQMPQVRVIPLPVTSGVAVPTAPTAGVGTSAAASSSSSTAVVTPTEVSVTMNTGVLAAGQIFTGTVQMAKVFTLLNLAATQICELRIYGSAGAQSFDESRPVDDPVSPEITSNFIVSANFDTVPFTWPCQDLSGVNQNTPRNSTIYVTVINTDENAVSNIAVTITYLPGEL